MELCLIRHAEPDWMAGGTGRMDPALTPRGHEQAALLAQRIGDWADVDEVWVSPAQRAQQTAAPLIEALGVPHRTLDWLLEVQGPDLEGCTPEEIASVFRGARYRPVGDWWAGLPGGEALHDFVGRIAAGVEAELSSLGAERAAEDPHWRGLPREHRVVIVSHAGTSGASLGHLLGLPPVPWAWERFRLGHAAMAMVRSAAIADGLIFALHGFNDRQHLPPELHTI